MADSVDPLPLLSHPAPTSFPYPSSLTLLLLCPPPLSPSRIEKCDELEYKKKTGAQIYFFLSAMEYFLVRTIVQARVGAIGGIVVVVVVVVVVVPVN